MSSTAAISASKRSAAGLEYGKQQSAKKSRIDDAAAGRHSNNKSKDDGVVVSKLMPNKFTHVHLRLLKVLYSQISRESDDGKVKEEQWKHMEQFLQDRESVKTMAAKVKITDAIRKETTAFEELLENDPAVAHTLMNVHPTALPSRWSPHHSSLPLSSSSSKTYSSSASKFSSARFFSGAAKFGFSSSPGSGRFSAMKQHQQQQQMQQNQPIDVDANPFGILSTFLIHKHQMSAKRFQRTTAPLQALAKDARQRVQDLSAKLKDIEIKRNEAGLGMFLLDTLPSSPSSEIETIEEERVCMETKLELWTILLQDVTRTMA